MEGDENQDVYTCGVCLEKINFQDLTNHVFLHDDYTAFSYDEATKIIEPITEAVKKSLENLQVVEHVEDPNQAYNLASTASALVDLGSTQEQFQDTTTILYEQPVQQQLDVASTVLSIPSTEGTVSIPNIQTLAQVPNISSFLGTTLEGSINQNPNIVGIQTHPTDTKKVQYVTIQKPTPKPVAITSYEKPRQLKNVNIKNISSYISNTAIAPKSNLSTLNEILVWNKGRALIPGETVTNVQVPIIENGTNRMTECSIVFNRFIPTDKSNIEPKPIKVRLGNNSERFEEVQAVDGLDDMDFEVYMDHSSGDTPTVVTYKSKVRKKTSGGSKASRYGRQMDNYKWRDPSLATDDVAKELRKSILPDIVRGSPAIAKYLQAMNIPADELEESLQQQSEEGQVTFEDHTVGSNAVDTNEPVNTEHMEQQVEIVDDYAEAAVGTDDMTAESVVTAAMNALVEASEMREQGQNEEIEPDGMEDESVNNNIEIINLPSPQVEAEPETEELNVEDGGNDADAKVIKIEYLGDNRTLDEDTETAEEDDALLEVEADLEENADQLEPIKEDGTAVETTEIESGMEAETLADANVRKSYRLQIKKEKKTNQKKPSAGMIKIEPLSDNDEDGQRAEDVDPGDDTPDEIASPGKKYGYFCSLCNTKLPPETVLKEHLESHRLAKRRTARGKGAASDSVAEIAAQPNKVFLYYCSLCNKMFPSEDELKQHCQKHKVENMAADLDDGMDDSDVELEEDLVENAMETKKSKRIRKRTAKAEAADQTPTKSRKVTPRPKGVKKSLQCEICERPFNTRAGLNMHKKTHEESERDLTHHKCPRGCGQRFKTEMEVDLHGPFCLRNKDDTDMKEAIEEELTDEDLRCPHCRKICDSKSNLSYHSLVCRERPYEKCPQCDFSCKGVLPMSRHQVQVHNLKPFRCDLCERTFRLKGSLRDHIASNHSEDKYVCEHCGKKFTKNNVYKRHVFVQHGGFRYPCNYCHKKFKDKRCWRIHENSHKGAYEYSCLPCKRSFSKAPDYKQHMLEVHNIAGPEALDLNKVAKELREKLCKIQCTLCKEKFPLEAAFYHHLQNKHGLSYDEAIGEYQRISGKDDTSFAEDFEELQKGQPLIDNE